MKKILFITSRNIINTCGELRLIKNRAETLYDKYKVSSDFFVYTNKNAIKNEEINAGGFLNVFKWSAKNPFSVVLKYLKLKQNIYNLLNKNNYDYIIVSGNFVLPLIKFIKNHFKIHTFVDMHGASEELIEFKGKSFFKKILRKFLFKYFKHNERKYIKYFDSILSVTHSLSDYINLEYGVKKHTLIVPCALNKTDLNIEEIFKNRKDAREKYNLNDSDILFVYSGGVSPWQCIEKSVEIFENIKKFDYDNRCKLLILSSDIDYIQKFSKQYIMIDSLNPDELVKILPAGDFAFMIRDNYITNNVAYPNKFLEYVSSGMKVITTPYVCDITKQVQNYDLGYILKDTGYEKELLEYCFKNTDTFGDDFCMRGKLIKEVSFENTLKYFGE